MLETIGELEDTRGRAGIKEKKGTRCARSSTAKEIAASMAITAILLVFTAEFELFFISCTSKN